MRFLQLKYYVIQNKHGQFLTGHKMEDKTHITTIDLKNAATFSEEREAAKFIEEDFDNLYLILPMYMSIKF